MHYIARDIEKTLSRAGKQFPALIVTGPRRAGKTTVLRRLFPKARYVLLEDPDVLARVKADPNGFLDELGLPVIIDEIQNVPELLRYIRTRIDRAPRKTGNWLLTGSQEAPLMRGVTESMAGRAAVFQLLPFSTNEAPKVSILRGGFPEVVQRPAAAETWFRSYIQTYLERDVRAVSAIRDLGTFRRFLALLVTRCGHVLNRTELAAPLGVSVPTIGEWLSILEVTGQIILAPPFFENFGKRLIKSPKLFFMDSGLVCHLLGITSLAALNRSAFLGPIFESFVASEIVKLQVHRGKAKALYHFRDQQGLEVDFIVPHGDHKLLLMEAKATRTPTPSMATPMRRLSENMRGYSTQMLVVCRGTSAKEEMRSLAPGVRAFPVESLAEFVQ